MTKSEDVSSQEICSTSKEKLVTSFKILIVGSRRCATAATGYA